MYLSALPVLLGIVAFFGALFCAIAWIAQRYANDTGVWIAWVLYVPAVSVGCILKLTGIAWGAPAQPGLVLYYVAVSFAALGIPFLASTLALIANARRSLPRAAPVAMLVAWLVAMAVTPLAIAAVAVVDAFRPVA